MRFRLFFAFGLTLLTATLTSVARAEDPLPAADPTAAPPPPAADSPPPSARINLILGGAATTLVSYGFALGTSFLVTNNDFNGSKDLRIPIAGPWIELGKTGCPPSDASCSKVPLVIGAVLSVFDGIAQAGGLGIIGEGLFLNTSSNKAAPQKGELGATQRSATGPTVRAVPFNFEKGGVGLGVIGTF